MGFLAYKLSQKNVTNEDFQRLAADICQRLLKVSSPEKIYIFGSYATGKISEVSDLDIAILFSDKRQLIESKKKILNNKLFLDFFTDILFYTTQDFDKKSLIGGVCAEIYHKGIIIYDKGTKV